MLKNLKTLLVFWSGVFVGGIIGAGCALLFAPRSGAETQTALKEIVLGTQDRVTEIKNQANSAYQKTMIDIQSKMPVLPKKATAQKIKLEQG